MKIAVAGLGYVGLSNGILFAQNHEVVGLDVNELRVKQVNNRESPVADVDIEHFLKHEKLSFRATLDERDALENADLVIIATPTDYDPVSNAFNTRSIEQVAARVLEINAEALIVIKSTVPVGYTAKLSQTLGTDRIVFSPEFLREGKALHDNLYPSRIIVGDTGSKGKLVADLLLQGARAKDTPVRLTGPTEAEAVKLFANTYLAMRVSFFNELDTFAATHELNTREIIEGVSLDPRVGNYYNNPSFGYGGYCLPKDTRQLLANYKDIPQNLIRAIVESNETRMAFIVEDIMKRKPKVVGIYRLVMKEGSDNFKESSIVGVMQRLSGLGVDMLVYEPTLTAPSFYGHKIEADLESFKSKCDVIVTNRANPALADVPQKTFSRDVFGES